MKSVLVAALTGLLAALPLTAGAEGTAGAAAAGAPAAPSITVVAPVRRTVRDRILASGTITPVERVAAQPQIEGQAIEALLADVGDRVEAGQVLARLSTSALALQESQLQASRAASEAAIAQAEAQLADARAAADEAQRVAERTEKLRVSGNASQAAADQALAAATSAAARVKVAQQGLESARAQLKVVEAQIADNDLRLSRASITAPVAGLIIERNAQVGAIASAAGQPLFVIARDGALELRADLAEQDVLRVAPGQRASIRAVGLDAPVGGHVRLVEPAVDPVTRLGRVRIALDAPGGLVAGLFAEAEIVAAEREALTVPVTAVASDAGGASVMRVDAEGRVVRTAVTTGIRDGAVIEITEGLAEGDRIVARAAAFVRDGDVINPVLTAGTAD
ncbi:MAG: efflux RND transporter periplasmic adaptor subunit [Rhodobacteraceae bacterium]|nr:efflux RND transporter periplasmic adaptor subunit [Paracoccaceae bacterium]